MQSRAQLPVPNILVVDHSPAALDLYAAWLGPLDARLYAAVDAREALGQVDRREFAVIITDVHMPGMDGFGLAKAIRVRRPRWRTPIIFVSSRDSSDETAYEVGASDYLRRPLNPNFLRAKVEVFLDLHQSRRRIQLQARSVIEAMQRSAALEREIELYQELAVEGRLGKQAGEPLKQRSPEKYRAVTNDYAALLDTFVDAIGEDITSPGFRPVAVVIRTLRALKAGSADVFDVHLDALNRLLRVATPARHELIRDESRRFVLMVSGRLLDAYRDRS
jgi:CheY-like chemotaxis protein